jgi:hypothetical protein
MFLMSEQDGKVDPVESVISRWKSLSVKETDQTNPYSKQYNIGQKDRAERGLHSRSAGGIAGGAYSCGAAGGDDAHSQQDATDRLKFLGPLASGANGMVLQAMCVLGWTGVSIHPEKPGRPPTHCTPHHLVAGCWASKWLSRQQMSSMLSRKLQHCGMRLASMVCDLQ